MRKLKRRGGYNVPLAGRPRRDIDRPAAPADLRLPLASRRFTFASLKVAEGDRVRPGQVLAVDPTNHDVPLLAPRAGTVRLEKIARHVVLEEVAQEGPEPAAGGGSVRERLPALGAWAFFEDAHTGELPDPAGTPSGLIVSTARLEPFAARGDVQLRGSLDAFARGLEHLQGLLAYAPMWLLVPDVQSLLAKELHEKLRGHAFLEVATIPLRYPMDNVALAARDLGLEPTPERPVWAVQTEGVLAVDRALTEGRPVTDRVVALGGPAARRPRHLEMPTGYPFDALREAEVEDGPVRLVEGGALTGRGVDGEVRGLDAECMGLTVLPEPTGRPLFGWIRPGFDRQSYSRTFLSLFRPAFAERMTTGLRGERRACIACGQCEEVCPARIMPHLIHKALYAEDLDRAEALGVDRCIGCALCSYVCPSKIELRPQFLEAQGQLREERAHAAEASAKAAAAAAKGAAE